MSYITNQAINSRSMNGILTITDGTAILEDGKLECENINVKTATITTLKDSDLVNCTTSTIASVDNDLVNKKYVVDNFVDRTNNLSQSINGLKTFTNNVEILNATNPSLILATTALANNRSIIRQNTTTSLSINNQNPASSIIFQINGSTCTTINNSQLLLPSNIFLTTNDIKSRAPTTAHTLLSDITTGTLTISSSTASNTLNGATQINQQTTFNNFTPISNVATPSAINHLTRKDYVDDNFVDKTNPQTIGGIKTFSVFPQVTATTPTLANQLIRKDYVDDNFVDRTNNLTQNINGLKTFTNNTNFTGSLLARTNYKTVEWENALTSNTITLSFPMSETISLRNSSGISMTITLPTLSTNERGMVFTFVKLTTANFTVTFNTSGGNAIYALNSITGSPVTNSTIFPINKRTCKLAVGWFGSATYWIEIGDYSTFDVDTNNSRYVDFTTSGQVISGNKTFSNITTTNILYTKDFRWNDASGGATIQQTYLTGSTFIFVPLFNSNIYEFQCRDAGAITTTPLIIKSASTTISNLLVSNNITAPVVLGGTNNIFTNLDTFTGGGIINIGAKSNNINVKCNLNIVESVYNNPTKITTINQEGNSCRFTNNGSTNGDYIFTIVESGTFNTFVINKTSVEIAGDAFVSGNLILYDTTPSTLSVSIGVLGNNMTFDPENTEDTTYNFKVNDSIGVTTTPLSISTDLTTINNDLTHKQTQMLNKVKIISGTLATLTLPLEQTLMLSSSGATNINITLPELEDTSQAGFTFNIIKTGSITNSVIFTRSGSNLLRTNGNITGSTSLTLMVNTSTIINMYSLEITSGNFEWILY